MMKAFCRGRSLLVNKIFGYFLIITIIIAIAIADYDAASAQSLTSINADITRLRTRINRLETELRNAKKMTNDRIEFPHTSAPNSNLYHPPVVDGRAIGSSDPLFQRLSTLLIELKEDVQNIDQRLTAVEAKVNQTQ